MEENCVQMQSWRFGLLAFESGGVLYGVGYAFKGLGYI